MADERLNNEREYQQALRETSSISSSIDRIMSSVSNSQNEISEKTQEQVSYMKSIVESVKTQEDLDQAIVRLEEQRLGLSQKFFGNNKRIAEQLKLTSHFSEESLESLRARLFLTDKLRDSVQSINDGFQQGYQSLVDQARQIPVIGSGLGWLGDAAAEYMGSITAEATEELADSLVNPREGLTSLGKKGKYAFGRISAAISGTMIVIAGFVAALGAAFLRFQDLEQATKAFREETGLLISQTEGLRDTIRNVSAEYATLGISTEEVSSAVSAFTKEFDNIRQASESTIANMVVLNKNFGVSFETAAGATEVFERLGGLTEAQSQFLTASTVEMARQARVAPEQVLSDIAKNSEVAYRFFGGSVEELSKAAVEAARLGSSLGQMAETADSLLNFESSITSELKASAMIGQDLNLSRARYLASTRQLPEMQQEIISQISKIGDITRLNTFQQDALTEATGMQFGELVKLQSIRQRFGKLDEDRLAAAKSYLDTQGDINNLSESELDILTERQAQQNEFRSTTEQISDTLGGIGTELLNAFLPLADFVMPILVDIVNVLDLVLTPLFRGIGAILGILEPILTNIYNILRPILGVIFAIVGALIEGFIEPFMVVKDIVSSFFEDLNSETSSFGEEAVEAFEPILDIAKLIGKVLGWVAIGVGTIVSILSGKFITVIAGMATAISWVFTNIVDFGEYMSGLVSIIVDIWNKFGWILGILNPMMGIAWGFQNVFSDISSLFDSLIEKATSLWNKFGWILGILNPMYGMVNLIVGLFTDWEGTIDTIVDKVSTVSSFVGGLFGGGEETEVGDAIINPKGEVVSTDPQDWLIATKDPTQLSPAIGGEGQGNVNINNNMQPVLAKLDELKHAFLSNKDVYMDRKKVSSTVKVTNERSRMNLYGLEVG